MAYFVDDAHGGWIWWLDGDCCGTWEEAGDDAPETGEGEAARGTEDVPPDLGKEACSTETEEKTGTPVPDP